MAEVKITRRDFPLVFERQTTEVHKIVVTRFEGLILEMEDFYFHFDSAVMLPDYDVAEAAADHITALTVLATGLAHARKFSTRKTMVAGHTDTSGAADYNVKLSQQRAECVLASWTGDKASFTNICLSKNKVEDYQQILKWAYQSKAYPCDPGPIDNSHGNGTSTALKNFKTAYNAEFSRSLPITGTCDKATWEAFFALYNQAITKFLSTDVEGLAAYRAALKWDDPGRKTVGCGENWPVDGVGLDNYRSATNRRVEPRALPGPGLPRLLRTRRRLPLPPIRYQRQPAGLYGVPQPMTRRCFLFLACFAPSAPHPTLCLLSNFASPSPLSPPLSAIEAKPPNATLITA